MMRTFLIIVGPIWFALASVFIASLLSCVLKHMPSPPWEAEDDFRLVVLEGQPAPAPVRAIVD